MADMSVYRSRRKRLASLMQSGVAVIRTASEQPRNRDTHFPFRHDSYFHYLSGFSEPEAVLVIIAGKKPRSILFCRDKDVEREIWDGFRYGPEEAARLFGLDEAYSVKQLDEKLPELLGNQSVLYCHMGERPDWDAKLVGWLNTVRAQVRSGIAAPANLHDVHQLLDEMRLHKDGKEVATMRRAAQISAGAHCRAMRATRPGCFEYEIEAELLHEFRRHGSQAPAYTSIVAAGGNACVLHYVSNNAQMKDGDLLLIDAGCELDGYASDITRTFPVNGKFSGPQKAIYELVLAAQSAAIAQVRPGKSFQAPHDAAVTVLVRGLVDLRLLKGSVEGLVESGDYRKFYMHRTSHWLGMDVHDCGDYKRGDKWRRLEAGMVLTVEPGCYIRPAADVAERFWNIGVRIEDDALVTDTGREILTRDVPKSVADIESLMRG
ncbi:MAG: Xaa-Pro aminopeptidase [Betaproteobacteria bacterium]|nr:Xaa-Pro aminopeptidase [Betaproteobacteria bacterium]